jgi:uncharacterized membrane protein
LGKPTITTLAGGAIAVAACAVGIVLKINPAWIVLAAGILGILTPQWFAKAQSAAAKQSNPSQQEKTR